MAPMTKHPLPLAKRRALQLAAPIAAVQVGYVLFVQSLPILLGIQVARGLGLGSYTSAAMTYAAESGTQETRGSSSGVFYATSSAGQLGGTLLAGTMAQAYGFTALYLTCAALATASGLCFLALRYRHPRSRSVSGTSPQTIGSPDPGT